MSRYKIILEVEGEGFEKADALLSSVDAELAVWDYLSSRYKRIKSSKIHVKVEPMLDMVKIRASLGI